MLIVPNKHHSVRPGRPSAYEVIVMLQLHPIPPYPPEDWTGVPAPVECGEPLVDLADLAPEIGYAAVYFRAGRPGALEHCFLRQTAAEMLKAASAALPEGWSLLVFDALRPLRVQQNLYDEIRSDLERTHPDLDKHAMDELVSQFVAPPRTDPARPAPHTTGGAVDLTLCYHGVPVDMGTDFDDPTPRSWTRYLEEHDENPTARDNRRLLYQVMTDAGFVSYACEWWHFSYGERLWAMHCGTTPRYGFHPKCKD